jgi:phosphoketolase
MNDPIATRLTEDGHAEAIAFPYARLEAGLVPDAGRTSRAAPGRGVTGEGDDAKAARLRADDPAFAEWAQGYGVIAHTATTQVRVHEMLALHSEGDAAAMADACALLQAADRLASAGMWLVVHMTYARSVARDGRPLRADEFKADPEGHTGGSLNMVPAYAGYLAANALAGRTRSWLMGQGHCVSAIDSLNLLVGNMLPEHAARYDLTDAGLSRFVADFYSYAIGADGRPASPLGSHVGAHTAGGMLEGGYLGFAELQYVHMPLPGESLVTFLSDGAFEEQRGADWVPRWWRAADCGAVLPIMIVNGRRIEQRTDVAQEGGVPWLRAHLRLNEFDPVTIDGRDPAAFVWAIVDMERRLAAAGTAAGGLAGAGVRLPYAIAETVKGYGFPGAGTNRAHNLPLEGNPAHDEAARAEFNRSAAALWVEPGVLDDAVARLNRHGQQARVRERDHPLAHRDVALPTIPPLPWRTDAASPTGATASPHAASKAPARASPMVALDTAFVAIVKANPHLRVRVGNPDELRSNRMGTTLDLLRHRVERPEAGVAEAIDGAVITALNEEAVVSAALGNKGGLNLVVSYEAFAAKMLGALRQEIIFARHLKEAGRPPRWLSVPVIATSHAWENGKNEQSHQDPTIGETLMGEMSDVSRVLFPPDWNTALASLAAVYATHATVATMIVPKRDVAVVLDRARAEAAVRDGAVRLHGSGAADERLLLAAVGAYQLAEARRASARLAQRGIAHALVSIVEPGRFRAPRDAMERAACADEATRSRLFPAHSELRVIVGHTRPEPLAGVLRPLDTGAARTRVLGYVNRGGTLDTFGMLFANRCTFAHVLVDAAELLGVTADSLLSADELAAVRGEADPRLLDAHRSTP